MSGGQRQSDKWQQVAELIARLGLVPNDHDQPHTAAQVARMTTRHLLQDPVRAAIYNRGWTDRTTDIERRLRPQPSALPSSSRNSSQSGPPRQQRAQPARAPAPLPPREPSPAPGPARVTPTPVVKGRTEAQQARNKRKFQKLKEKRQARERNASQQQRLAKLPAPVSEPGAASTPPTQPTQPTAMEVDAPAAEGHSPKELRASTSQVQQDQASTVESTAVDAWLAAPGLSLEELPEVQYDNKSFFTPVGSPDRP